MAKLDLEFDGFSSLSVTQSIDNIADEFKLDMLQTHSIQEFFRPFAYTPVELKIGNSKPFLTGRILATSANYSAGSLAVSVQGASLAVTLAQSTLPSIQMDGQNLFDIVNFVAQKFGLKAKPNITAPRVQQARCDTGTNAFEFLNNLAKDHNCLIYSDTDGSILLDSQEPDVSKALLLHPDDHIGADLSISFDGSKLSRLYVAHGQTDNQNIFAQYVYETVPFMCIKHIDAQENPAQKIHWQLLRDNIEAYSLTIRLPKWENPNGEHWQKGQILKLDYPQIWLEGYYRARSISFEMSNNEKSTSMSLEKILER